jgi:anaerobic selenocysteine-containing dehydrogenase
MQKPPAITRRKFIDLSVQGTAALSLSPALLMQSCSNSPNPITTFGACYHDCPDACSWKVSVQDGKVTKFGPNPLNRFTGDSLCSKMDQFPDDVTFHPDRILTPLKRTGPKGAGQFEAVSWEQAIKEITDQLKQVTDQYGGEAILPYCYAGTEGLVQRNTMGRRFFSSLQSSRLDGTICGNTADAGIYRGKGTGTGMLPEDIVQSKYIILWGTNTKHSNQHLWQLIQQARKQGAKLVVIDTFRSATSEEADWHLQPMPGTDVLLALAMIQVILEEKLEDADYIANYTLGIEKLRAHVQAYSPESVTEKIGIPPEDIRRLARDYAAGTPSVIRLLIGMEHQANGGNAFWAVSLLPSLTGAWRKQGGGLLHMTYELYSDALNWESIYLTDDSHTTRSINMVEIGKRLNDPNLDPRLHALFVYNSNPAVIAPNQNEVIRGLKRAGLFTVVLEHFVTDTARYADYILPATTQLEHWDLLNSWGSTYLNINQPAIAPQGEAKPNNEIFRLLADGMGYTDDFFKETDLEILKKTLDSTHSFMKGITFESLMKTGTARLNLPEPWVPHAEGNFNYQTEHTVSPLEDRGKCQLYFENSATPLPTYTPFDHGSNKDKYPLRLLAIKSKKGFLNTSHANVSRLRKEAGTFAVEIHEADASARGIKAGDEVRVYNQYGEITLGATISDRIRPGVVSIPQGYWPSLLKGGSSANALTTDVLADMGGGGAFFESIVEVRRM